MIDAGELLRRQTEWQRARRLLPWPEKIRMALAMRPTLLRFRELRATTRQVRENEPDLSKGRREASE